AQKKADESQALLRIPEEAVASIFQVLTGLTNKDLAVSSEAKVSLRRLVYSLLSLPHREDLAWRFHLLASAILLMLQPPDPQLKRLMERLPAPEAALAPGGDGKDLGPLLTDLLREQLFPGHGGSAGRSLEKKR
ncbi:Ferredoxin, partial [Symbiodinium pilosum]